MSWPINNEPARPDPYFTQLVVAHKAGLLAT